MNKILFMNNKPETEFNPNSLNGFDTQEQWEWALKYDPQPPSSKQKGSINKLQTFNHFHEKAHFSFRTVALHCF